jgi:hypothetical protein
VPPSLETLGGFLSSSYILIAGAPKEHAAGHLADRDGDIELASDAQNIVFHPSLGDLGPQTNAGRLGTQGLDFLAQGIIEQGLHTRGPAHETSFLEGNIFELDGGLLGHGSRPLSCRGGITGR